MVRILTQRKALLAYLFTAALALFFLFQSGVSADFIFKPMTVGAKTISGGLPGINVLYLLMSILLLPLAYSILCMYSLSTEEIDLTVAVAPLMLSLVVFFYLGLSLPSIVISVGLVLSAFFAHYSSFRDKECYKKISYYGLASKATKCSLLLLSIFILLAVYLALPASPAEVQKSFEKDLSGPMNDTLPALQATFVDSQRKQSHALLGTLEDALLASAENGAMPSLTPEEKTRCSGALKDNMQKIDSEAKALIDTRLEEQKKVSLSASLIPESLMRQLSRFYPLLVILSLFFILEMFRLFSGIFSGLYGMLLGRLTDFPSSAQAAPGARESSSPSSTIGVGKSSVAPQIVRDRNNPLPGNKDPYYQDGTGSVGPRYRGMQR